MKKPIVLLAAALAFVLSSCIEHNAVIVLNKDGSGTLTEETLLGVQTVQMIEQMSALGGENAPDPIAGMADEAKAKAAAAKMGEGVSLVKVEKIDENGRKGGRVVFAFKDINQLKYLYGKSMSDMGDDMKPPGAPEEESKVDEPLSFSYQDGVLTLRNPNVNAKAEKPETPAQEMDDQSIAMAQQMLGDMRMSLKIKLPGGIKESTASHVEGDTVTLMNLDMGEVVKDPAKFKQFAMAQPETPAEMQEALKNIDGAVFETKEEITVTLK